MVIFCREKLLKSSINGDFCCCVIFAKLAKKYLVGSLDPFQKAPRFFQPPRAPNDLEGSSSTWLGGNKNHQNSHNLLVKYRFIYIYT